MPVLIWQCSAQPSLSNHHRLSNWCQGKGDCSLYMMEKPDVIHATAKAVVASLQISVGNLSMTINKTAYNRQHGSALTQYLRQPQIRSSSQPPTSLCTPSRGVSDISTKHLRKSKYHVLYLIPWQGGDLSWSQIIYRKSKTLLHKGS